MEENKVSIVNADTVQSAARYVAKTLAGAAVAHGLIKGDLQESLIAAIVSVAGLAWGIYSAHQAAKSKSA
jgi:hypothetical protein